MNKFLLSLLIIMAATGMARADIASTKYVDENALTAGDNVQIADGIISVQTCDMGYDSLDNATCQLYDSTPVSMSAFYDALQYVLPYEYFQDPANMGNWESTAGMYGGNIYFNIEDLVSFTGLPGNSINDETPMDGMSLYERTVYINDELDKKQPLINGYERCYIDEGGYDTCDTVGGSIVTNAIVTANQDGKLKAVRISDSGTGQFVTDIAVTDDGAVTLTRANAPETTVDSALSTTSTNPVQNKVVTSALNSKQNKIPAVVSDEEDGADVSGFVVIEPDGVVKGVPVQLDSSCDGEDGTVCYVSGIGVGADDGTADKVAVYESQIKFGNGLVVDFTEESDDPVVTVVSANATIAGVATWGTIPAGSATSTTSAKIWIE